MSGRWFLIAALVLACLASSPVAAAPQTISLETAFADADQRVSDAVREDGWASVSYALVVDNSIAHRAAFGKSDEAEEALATPEHVYRIGSITKQFTAFAILKLATEGKLQLSEPVSQYVPEIREVDGYESIVTPITIRQLATMTSGLAREPKDLPKFLVGPAEDWFSVVERAIPAVTIDWEPDSRYQYSNIGYAILGRVVGQASGTRYMDYVRREFIEPLAMVDTDFVPRERFRERVATGYVIADGSADPGQPTREHAGRGYKVPNGALYSTVADLAAFLRFQMGGGPETVIDPVVLADNLSRVNSADASLTRGYGLGFQVRRRGDLVIYGHGGSVAGYRAGAYFEPERKLGVVVLRNATGTSIDVTELSYELMEMLVQAYDRTPGATP